MKNADRVQSEAQPVISLKNVSFRRGSKHILADVHWTIAKGEHWALIGSNGSGKTTLLKIVTGYEWPTEGSVEVLGQRFGECDLRALRKLIGWVSSALEHRVPGNDSALMVVESGFEASLGVYRPISEIEIELAHAVLQTVGAEDLAQRAYNLLSQGEQQRVLIARALVCRPTLLILDEPCAGLDPSARHRFLEDLGKLAQLPNAPTLVLVTHHIEEIGPWVNRVLALKDGHVFANGYTADILTDDTLSEVFSSHCEVSVDKFGYRLRVLGAKSIAWN